MAALNGHGDEDYYKSYGMLGIHETMIGDSSRTMAYYLALLHSYNKLYKGVVADVGAGTGILSIFAVQAGASKVYAIEASSIADVTQKMIAENGMTEKIELIRGRAEDVSLETRVDAIVSEWMGHCLLYENMLESVLDFRDRHLKPDGLMFPNKCSLYIAAFSDDKSVTEEASDFWSEIESTYKLKFSPIKDAIVSRQTVAVDIVPISQEGLRSNECRLFTLDIKTMHKDDLKMLKGDFTLSCFGVGRMTSLALWFDVDFPDGSKLSTSPHSTPTHWMQSLLPLANPINITQDTVIGGTVTFSQGKTNKRYLEVSVEVTVQEGETLVSTLEGKYSLTD